MNLESQVTSLELSKKLHELGVKQESLFYWYKDNNEWLLDYNERLLIEFRENYSAFTASELLELLPHRITIKENEPFNNFTLYIKKSFIVKETIKFDSMITTYIINYECESTECRGENAWLKRQLFTHNIWDENFSNALAKILIFLIENEIIKHDE